MYTAEYLGRELKERVRKNETPEKIGEWAYEFYLNLTMENVNLLNIAITLSTMADGPEFAFSYEELEKIADDLIAGKAVKL